MEARDIKELDAETADLVQEFMTFLDCPCHVIRPMENDDEIMQLYQAAYRRGREQGFTPVLVKCDDILLECMEENSGADQESDTINSRAVAEFRTDILGEQLPLPPFALRPNWNEQVYGSLEEGWKVEQFASYWSRETDSTDYLLLAEIPVAQPWQVFAYLPFGGWNDCPDTLALMAAAKHWYEQYGAVPAAISHDELEFYLPKPVQEQQAKLLAVQHAAFCPDRIEQCGDGCTIGRLAGDIANSTVWYFWWD